MRMTRLVALGAAGLLVAAGASASVPNKPDEPREASAQHVEQAKKFFAQVDALGWVHGPAKVPLAGEATIALPRGMRYLDPEQTSRFLQLNGNPPTAGNYTVAPEGPGWFAIYSFDPSGYVSDTEKIDPEALLASMRKNQDAGNEERKKLGISTLSLDGWTVVPHYDRASHNLEWGTAMHDDQGATVVNYTTRMLGRGGVMSATLVTDPAAFAQDLAAFRGIAGGFAYLPERRYEAHQKGDKLAAYGLGALITGGAAALAVKTGAAAGLFALIAKFGIAFGKFIAVGAVALFAAIRRFGRRLLGRPADGEG